MNVLLSLVMTECRRAVENCQGSIEQKAAAAMKAAKKQEGRRVQ